MAVSSASAAGPALADCLESGSASGSPSELARGEACSALFPATGPDGVESRHCSGGEG